MVLSQWLQLLKEVIVKIAYLVFAPNRAFVKVQRRKPKGVKLSPDGKEWTLPGARSSDGTRTTFRSGEGRYLRKRRDGGIIGVYDLDRLEHVKIMANDAIQSQRNGSRPVFSSRR